jgi:DNA/RNA-binding domain of Phe-tRNA-synthetase-like protein
MWVDQAPQIRIVDAVAQHVGLEALRFAPVAVRVGDEALAAALDQAAEEAYRRYSGADVATLDSIRDVRAMYSATGTDPTKRRPSSEALLRRALQGEPLPRINTLVDCVNLFSLAQLVPVGLYDLDRVRGTIVCRLGLPGEPYEAIGREAFSVHGRMVLADDEGPFGSPTSDSRRTMVTTDTLNALAVVYWPAGRQERSSAGLSDLVARFCGPGG